MKEQFNVVLDLQGLLPHKARVTLGRELGVNLIPNYNHSCPVAVATALGMLDDRVKDALLKHPEAIERQRVWGIPANVLHLDQQFRLQNPGVKLKVQGNGWLELKAAGETPTRAASPELAQQALEVLLLKLIRERDDATRLAEDRDVQLHKANERADQLQLKLQETERSFDELVRLSENKAQTVARPAMEDAMVLYPSLKTALETLRVQ